MQSVNKDIYERRWGLTGFYPLKLFNGPDMFILFYGLGDMLDHPFKYGLSGIQRY